MHLNKGFLPGSISPGRRHNCPNAQSQSPGQAEIHQSRWEIQSPHGGLDVLKPLDTPVGHREQFKRFSSFSARQSLNGQIMRRAVGFKQENRQRREKRWGVHWKAGIGSCALSAAKGMEREAGFVPAVESRSREIKKSGLRADIFSLE